MGLILESFLNTPVTLGSGEVKVWQLIVAAAIVFLIIVVIIVCAIIAAKKKKKENVNNEAQNNEEVNITASNSKTDEIVAENMDDNTSEYAKTAAYGIEQTPVVVEREEQKEVEEIPEEIEEEPAEETVEEPASEEIEIVESDKDEPVVVIPEESAEEPVEEVVEEPVEEQSEEEVVEEPVEEPTDKIEEETADEEPAEEPAEEPVEETEEETEEEPVEEVVAEEVTEEKKEPKKATKAAPKKDVKKTTKAKPVSKKETKKPEPKEEKEVAKTTEVKPRLLTDARKKADVKGKFEVCNSVIGGYNYLLRANNGQLLYESKTYKSIDSCTEAISKFIDSVEAGNFTIRADKFKNYKFILKSPTSNLLIYVGESFTSKDNCESNINSVKRFAPISPVFDITREDFEAKFDIYEITKDVKKIVAKGEGAVGKWEISQVDENDKKSPFTYTLTANNGQLLYESRDYTTKASCKQGLETFVETIKDGYFIIDPDKAGRFKFVLRSKNSLMEYEGQNYDTKQACAKNIESVYRFALLTPIEKK